MKFDHSDFVANPNKYRLYTTAKLSSHVFTHNGEHDLEPGQYVAIKHMRNAWNGLRHREEPVYSITSKGKVWGVMFASCLSEFVL